ncbi:MAG: hypothetical protein J0L96_13375 [Anaerolineae bacterium]|nr:hypothetical protein [Anaerolineae bacterium]
MLKTNPRKSERGQAIVLIAVAMVGLIAMVGLMTDGGMMLIEYGKLKRAVDAASISASQQFRRGFTGADLSTAAETFLNLNQSDAANINVYRCKRDPDTGTLDTSTDGTLHDETLCTLPRRKLVRVEATRTVQFGFMRVLGFTSANLTTSAVGEAASIDMVLIIDTSASMAYETYAGGNGNIPDHPSEDPSACNASISNPCEPLDTVKNVADEFLDNMFFPYDRVSIVAMTNQSPNAPNRDHVTVIGLDDNESAVRTALGNLRVYQPPACDWGSPANPANGPCINYTSGTFIGLDCPIYRLGVDLLANTGDEVNNISSCNSSNIGGAFRRAALEFTNGLVREDSLWIVLALAGGPANATDSFPGYLDGFCPTSTWNSLTNPFCRDASAVSRHSNGDANYDADDYARDMADYLADPVTGQGVTVFTIGLGNLIRNASKGDATAGEQLLEYAAETAGGVSANHGEYFFSPNSSGLAAIFDAIARNIFTRISR